MHWRNLAEGKGGGQGRQGDGQGGGRGGGKRAVQVG